MKQKHSPHEIRMGKQSLFSFLLTALMCCSFFFAKGQTAYYKITFKTSSSSDAGCDNGIDIQLISTGGKKLAVPSNPMLLIGNDGLLSSPETTSIFPLTITAEHLNGQEEVQIVANKDLGSIDWIMLDIDGVLIDDWKPEYIKIERSNNAQGGDVDGSSFFEIDKFIGYDPVYFKAKTVIQPSVSLTEDGEPEIIMASGIVTNWVDNSKGASAQLGVKVKDIHTKVETVGVHVTEGNEVGISATVSYESPETAYGKFGAELTGSYNEMVSKAEYTQNENMQTVEQDWSYDVPAQSFAFRAINFDIPYGYQKIKAGDVQAVIRMLGKPPIRKGESFINIPNKDPYDGSIYPVLWQEIEEKYLQNLDSTQAQTIVSEYKDYWIRKGWVVTDPAMLDNTIVGNNGGGSQVGGSTKEPRANKYVQKIKNGKNGIVICLPPPTTLTAEGLPYKYSIKRKDDNTVEIYAEPIKAGEKPVAKGEIIKLDSKKE